MSQKKIFLLCLLLLNLNCSADDAYDAEIAYDKKEYIKAAKLAEKSCRDGNALSCTALGRLYKHGHGVKKDYIKADEYFKKACKAGIHESCKNIGMKYDTTILSSEIQSYTNLCNTGDSIGCYKLGRAYYRGDGIAKDITKGMELLNKSCDANYGKACSYIGITYQFSRPNELDKMEAYYLKACSAGDAEPCGNLGYLYSRGLYVKKDEIKGMDFLKKGCDGGYTQACINLTGIYKPSNGEDYRDVIEKNLQLLSKACDAGDASGCMKLGQSKDGFLKASKLFMQSCENGNAQACNTLGELYERGQGITQDRAKAESMYGMSCELDPEFQCYHLGERYEKGKGVERNHDKAIEAYKKGCDAGSGLACRALSTK